MIINMLIIKQSKIYKVSLAFCLCSCWIEKRTAQTIRKHKYAEPQQQTRLDFLS